MSVLVKLYKYTGEAAIVDKILDEEHAAEFSCVFRDTQDVMNPEIIVTAAAMPDVNYMYISRYKRYYWLDPPRTYPNGKWILTGHEDVLKTYASAIKALTGTVDRQENLANGYVPDPEYIAKGYKQIVTKAFPNEMTGDSFILMTVG